MKNTNYFLGIMMGIVGLMMLLAAEGIVQVLVIVLGIFAIFNGAFTLATIAPLSQDNAFRTECIVRGATGIVVGLLCIILPLKIAGFVWQTFVYVFAVYAIASAVLEIPIAKTLYEDGFPVKRYVIEIVSTIILGIVLFLLPTSFGFTIIRIGGAILLLVGAGIAFMAYKNRDIVADDAVVADEEPAD